MYKSEQSKDLDGSNREVGSTSSEEDDITENERLRTTSEPNGSEWPDERMNDMN